MERTRISVPKIWQRRDREEVPCLSSLSLFLYLCRSVREFHHSCILSPFRKRDEGRGIIVRHCHFLYVFCVQYEKYLSKNSHVLKKFRHIIEEIRGIGTRHRKNFVDSSVMLFIVMLIFRKTTIQWRIYVQKRFILFHIVHVLYTLEWLYFSTSFLFTNGYIVVNDLEPEKKYLEVMEKC